MAGRARFKKAQPKRDMAALHDAVKAAAAADQGDAAPWRALDALIDEQGADRGYLAACAYAIQVGARQADDPLSPVLAFDRDAYGGVTTHKARVDGAPALPVPNRADRRALKKLLK